MLQVLRGISQHYRLFTAGPFTISRRTRTQQAEELRTSADDCGNTLMCLLGRLPRRLIQLRQPNTVSGVGGTPATGRSHPAQLFLISGNPSRKHLDRPLRQFRADWRLPSGARTAREKDALFSTTAGAPPAGIAEGSKRHRSRQVSACSNYAGLRDWNCLWARRLVLPVSAVAHVRGDLPSEEGERSHGCLGLNTTVHEAEDVAVNGGLAH